MFGVKSLDLPHEPDQRDEESVEQDGGALNSVHSKLRGVEVVRHCQLIVLVQGE
jgi:hypothetical protein